MPVVLFVQHAIRGGAMQKRRAQQKRRDVVHPPIAEQQSMMTFVRCQIDRIQRRRRNQHAGSACDPAGRLRRIEIRQAQRRPGNPEREEEREFDETPAGTQATQR